MRATKNAVITDEATDPTAQASIYAPLIQMSRMPPPLPVMTAVSVAM